MGGVAVHKVLNNNVVIQIDASGRERVLIGRGIGFQLKPTDSVDPARIEKTFILDFQSFDQMFATEALPALLAAKVDGTGIPMKVFHDPADFDPAQMAKLVFVTEDQDAAARALTDLGIAFVALGLASGPRRRAGEWMT